MAAVNLDTYAPFDAGSGANVMEDVWRKMMRHVTLGRSGVLKGVNNNMQVYGDSSGMQVKVKTGECWLRGHWGEITSEKTLTITAAHPTLSRVDRAVARVDFSANTIAVDIVAGTAAGSPIAPAVTQNSSVWEVSLATISIPAADTSIGANQVTDARFYANFTGARYYNGSAFNLPNASMTQVDFPTGETTCGDIVQVDNNTFQLNLSGWWQLDASVRFFNNGSGYRQVVIGISDHLDDTGYDWWSSEKVIDQTGSPIACSVSGVKYAAAGTQVAVGAYQNSGSSQVTDPDHNAVYFAMTWMGP